MKTIDLFCASPASTAICSSVDQRAVTRPIDRHIHRLGGTPRARTNAAPCSSQLPFDPSRPFRRTASDRQTDLSRRKGSSDTDDLPPSPAGSARYLLSGGPFLDIISDSERGPVSNSSRARMIRDDYNIKNYRLLNLDGLRQGLSRSLSTRLPSNKSPVFKPSSLSTGNQKNVEAQKCSPGKLRDHLNAQKSLSDSKSSQHQVVELWVSIHCKGCEGKVRKYLSKMEGVISFSIDLDTKKVTVIGDVTPLGVLTSISKVKNAQFWPSPAASSSISSPSPGVNSFTG